MRARIDNSDDEVCLRKRTETQGRSWKGTWGWSRFLFCLDSMILKIGHVNTCFHASGNDPVDCEKGESSGAKELSR